MAINVLIPAPLRAHTDGQTSVSVGGDTVGAALQELTAKHPALRERIFDAGRVRRFLNLYVNDEDVRYLDALETAVKPGDELSIIPAVAGG
jgi:molybdopterin converting factor small subunit